MNLLKQLVVIAIFTVPSLCASGSQPISEKKSLTLEGARRLIAAAEAYAKEHNAPGGAIAVVDNGGNLIALERLEGTFSAGSKIATGKARTAVLFKQPTRVLEELINKGRTTMVALEDFTPLQGGIPILVSGEIVGGIGVSGTSSAQQDEEVAMAGAEATKQFGTSPLTSSQPAGIGYFPREKVDASFPAGAALFDPGGNCVISTSRRDSSGVDDLQGKDPDILDVLAGLATFITCGTLLDGKKVAENESRSTELHGGAPRTLVAGDEIVVPAGTPQWFKRSLRPVFLLHREGR